MTRQQPPRIGRVVHFKQHVPGSPINRGQYEEWAAIITRVSGNMANLTVFMDSTQDYVPNVVHGSGPMTWHWHEECEL